MSFTFDLFALKLFMRIMLAFAFAGSLFVLIDPEVYKKLNSILTKEYGIKKKLMPIIESEKTSLDQVVLQNRKLLGSLFLVLSFVLLTLY